MKMKVDKKRSGKNLGYNSRMMAVNAAAGINARTAADAGIIHALRDMNNRFVFGGPWDNSWIPYTSSQTTLSNTNSSYTYTITGPVGELWSVVSAGTSGRETKTVQALLSFTNLFDYALIVTDKIILKNDILVDGYDSSKGLYDPTKPSEYLRIGTTSILEDMIILNNGVTVKGDVLVGKGGVVEDCIVDHGASTGPRYPMMSNFEFEDVNAPACTPAGFIDELNLTIGTPGVTSYLQYDSINIRQSGVMEVHGNVFMHVTGDIRLNQSAEIRIMPPLPGQRNSLTIYLDGNIQAGNSNGINNMTYIPSNFFLFGTGPGLQDWDIQNGGDFYGVYYGPNADIIIRAKGDFYGSVSGLRFDLRAGGNLHYDIALSDISAYDTGFKIERWWEQ
ncbi:MAG: DUF7305 domain-containing protein [Planctomycetota bacterium]|jgi:hypothetical protein